MLLLRDFLSKSGVLQIPLGNLVRAQELCHTDPRRIYDLLDRTGHENRKSGLYLPVRI